MQTLLSEDCWYCLHSDSIGILWTGHQTCRLGVVCITCREAIFKNLRLLEGVVGHIVHCQSVMTPVHCKLTGDL